MHGRMSVSMFSPDFVRACVFLGCISVPIGVIFYRLFFYMVSMLGLYRFYWLHQWRIPRHTCRFYCSLRGHQRTGTAGFANPPFPILWTLTLPPGDVRCGGALLLPRVWDNIGFRYPVQVDYRQFGIWFGYLCSGWYRSRFSRVVGLWSHVFHYWGEGRLCLRLRGVLLCSFVGFALTAIGSFVLFGDGMG